MAAYKLADETTTEDTAETENTERSTTCLYLHFWGLIKWHMSANLHSAPLKLREGPHFLISLYSSTCKRPRFVSNRVWKHNKHFTNAEIMLNYSSFRISHILFLRKPRKHTDISTSKRHTFIVRFKHSSATIRISDSWSSHRVRNASIAMPRNLGKSAIDLAQ